MEWGSGATPVPDRDAVAGEFVAVLTKDTVPLAAPLVPGVNVRVTCFVVPAAIESGNVSPVALNPDPVTFAAETATEPVPVFESITVCVVLNPTTTLPKETLVGAALRRNVAAVVAVPDKATVGAVLEALLVVVKLPEKVPAAAGANLTLRLTDCPAGIEIGKVAPTKLNPLPVTVAFVTDIAVPPMLEI